MVQGFCEVMAWRIVSCTSLHFPILVYWYRYINVVPYILVSDDKHWNCLFFCSTSIEGSIVLPPLRSARVYVSVQSRTVNFWRRLRCFSVKNRCRDSRPPAPPKITNQLPKTKQDGNECKKTNPSPHRHQSPPTADGWLSTVSYKTQHFQTPPF